MLRLHEEIDRVVFESDMVRIGTFRCHPDNPSFQEGPAQYYCFVFPRTAVEIQHEHEPAFVANPNVVTFYNAGQAYWRNPISPEGDRCDCFGVEPGLVRDALACSRLNLGWIRSVAVVVAVHLYTSTTFQAHTNGSLCAQDLCKLMVNREFM
jgi:hypothetical protein